MIISQLIDDFGDEKFNQLICEMKKSIVTQTTTSRRKQKLFDKTSTINANRPSLSQKIKWKH